VSLTLNQTHENWDSKDHNTIREEITGGNGTFADYVSEWKDIAAEFQAIGEYIEKSMQTAVVAQEGAAADAQRSAISPLAGYALAARLQAEAVAERISDQSAYRAEAMAAMPEAMSKPEEPWYNPLVPGESDYDKAMAEYERRNEEARDAMRTYEANTNSNLASMPTFEAPPPATFSVADAGGGQQVGSPYSSGTGSYDRSMGTGYQTGSSQPADTHAAYYNGVTNPTGNVVTPVGPGGPGGTGTPVGTPPQGGNPGPVTPPGTYPLPGPNSPGPRPGIPTGPLPGPGTGSGGGGTRPGTGPFGRGTGPFGGGLGEAGGRSGFGPGGRGVLGVGGGAGVGGGLGAGGGVGAGGPGGRGGFGPGGAFGPGAGLGPEDGVRGGMGGRGGAVTGVGAGMAGGARGGQGEEDKEHRRPDYLIEMEDIFDDGRRVAPPVIGERPPGM